MRIICGVLEPGFCNLDCFAEAPAGGKVAQLKKYEGQLRRHEQQRVCEARLMPLTSPGLIRSAQSYMIVTSPYMSRRAVLTVQLGCERARGPSGGRPWTNSYKPVTTL